jgi:hypothetical protein
MRYDPMRARCVFAYHDSDGHLHCYASNLDTEFTQIRPTTYHKKIQPTGRDNSWILTTDDNTKNQIDLYSLLISPTWFENVWNFVRNESTYSDTVPPPLPFLDAADCLKTYSLEDMRVVTEKLKQVHLSSSSSSSPQDLEDTKRQIIQLELVAPCGPLYTADQISPHREIVSRKACYTSLPNEALWSRYAALMENNVLLG